MAARACLARLRKECKSFEPPPYIRAAPLESNLQEWRFVLQGPPDSPYEGGLYQGKVRFPDDYPFKPPSIFMLTPNGRFETDRRLCLSISDFHPESWVPTWSVATILNGVLSFMLETSPTTGSVETTLAEKHALRAKSVAFNAKDPTFCALFPELVDGTLFTDPKQPDGSTNHAIVAPELPEKPSSSSATAAPAADGAGGDGKAMAAGGWAETASTAALDWAAAVAEDDDDEEEDGKEEEGAAAAASKNAKKNAKKREKEKAKKAAAANAAIVANEKAPAVDVD